MFCASKRSRPVLSTIGRRDLAARSLLSRYDYLLILAHESFSVTVRLNTRMLGRRVGIGAEVTHALELVGAAYGRIFERGFEQSLDLDQRFGVEVILPRGLSGRAVVGVLGQEQRVEQTYLRLEGVLGRTQCMTPFTRRPSLDEPSPERGSYVQCSSMMLPSASFITSSHFIRYE